MNHADLTILDEELKTLDDQIETVKGEITSLEGQVKDKKEELDASKGKEKDLTDRRTALKTTKGDIEKVHDQVASMRESLTKELNDVSENCRKVSAILSGQLSQKYLTDITQIRADVDQNVAMLKAEMDGCRREMETAGAEVEAARKLSREADACLVKSQDELRQLPAKIQSAKAEVMRMKTAMENAYTKDLRHEAFLQTLELGQKLGETGDLFTQETVEKLIKAVDTNWQAAKTAKDELQKATTKHDALKSMVAEAEKAYQNAVAKRKTDIDKKVGELDDTEKA